MEHRKHQKVFIYTFFFTEMQLVYNIVLQYMCTAKWYIYVCVCVYIYTFPLQVYYKILNIAPHAIY